MKRSSRCQRWSALVEPRPCRFPRFAGDGSARLPRGGERGACCRCCSRRRYDRLTAHAGPSTDRAVRQSDSPCRHDCRRQQGVLAVGSVTGAVRVAVDGGGSKTVAAVVDPKSGAVLAQFEGAGCRYNILGIDGAVAVVNEAVTSALAECATREDQVEHASLFLTMIDFPEDREAWHSALAKHLWAQGSIRVDNDIFALLRSGTSSDNAAAVVCGTGMNGIAVRHDGARATLAALGRTSGDFGGGAGLAAEILWHAARADDGRGPETALRDALLGWTGASDMESLYRMIRFDGLNPEAWMDQTREPFRHSRRRGRCRDWTTRQAG